MAGRPARRMVVALWGGLAPVSYCRFVCKLFLLAWLQRFGWTRKPLW